MNDYLANLISRSFAATPAVRSRLPSMFESAGAALSEEAQDVASESSAKEHRAHRTSEQLPASSNTRANVREPSHRDPSPQPNSPEREGGSLPFPLAFPEDSAPTRAETPRAEEQDLATENAEVNLTPQPFRPASTSRERLVRPLVKSLSPFAIRPEMRHEAVPPDSRIHPLPAPPAESAAPVVHVTIGRVEVRAIHSPAPGPKAGRAPASTLSLQEYLQSSEGGRR